MIYSLSLYTCLYTCDFFLKDGNDFLEQAVIKITRTGIR